MAQCGILSTKVTPYSDDIEQYLEESSYIDYQHPTIQKLADELMEQAGSRQAYMEAAFTYVRDQIAHSADAGEQMITRTASEVLAAKHGICFAKSHLLTALLRARQIPAGLCYQKLILSDEQPDVLIYHGLCGVYLEEEQRWIRLDARGNKTGVDAQFSTTKEQLAFPIRRVLGEEDLYLVYPRPDEEVIKVLTENTSRVELWENLPVRLAYRNER